MTGTYDGSTPPGYTGPFSSPDIVIDGSKTWTKHVQSHGDIIWTWVDHSDDKLVDLNHYRPDKGKEIVSLVKDNKLPFLIQYCI